MSDPSLTPERGRVLLTGGSGFEGGYHVRSFDRAPSPLSEHPQLEVLQGDICDPGIVTAAVDGIDTVFHTAAIIELLGGASASDESRQRSFAVNVGDTENLVRAARVVGVKRFVYTSSDSVADERQAHRRRLQNTAHTDRFNDLYTETKVIAERSVSSQNGVGGMLTCAIRPSGIWAWRPDHVCKIFESMVRRAREVLIGRKAAKIDNAYIHNLIHGFIPAAQHLVADVTAAGQAYFINDGEPINMFEYARPVVEACGQRWPRLRISGAVSAR